MKKVLGAVLACGLLLSGCSSSNTGKKNKSEVKIGVIQFVQHDALDASYKGFKEEVEKAGYKIDDKNVKNASGETSNCETIASQLVNDRSDLIYAIATPAAQAVANKTKDIPIVVSAVTDPATSKLVKSNSKPDTNVTGASDLTPVKEQMELLKKLMPKAKNVGILYNGSESNSEFQAKIAIKEAKALGFTTVSKTVSDSNDVQAVTDSFAGKVDAVYIPTDNLLAANMPTVIQSTNASKIPVIVGEKNMVTHGGLATYGIDYNALGHLAGKQAVSILEGKEKPQTMPIKYLKASDCELSINKKQAERFGISIPEDLKKQVKYI
ncbi:MAG: ABC transporter substrate binding protein [Eggerthia catenaformis]|uniref:ABC transporter substrate-binding protein n=1 Tax=Eggerthia catenaformis TaxID=31973 RepID=UPI00047E0390|nr:ABC transporter substrate-binding protein [Eggerthia catenaformis]OUC51504.1 sugar ABC transporter substrate-binding protein [Eggerthia catenaformis]